MKKVHIHGDLDQPTIWIGEQDFELEDVECDECGFIKCEDQENVAHALEEWWESNSPCYVEVCDCEEDAE